MASRYDFSRKRALVTGAGKGIGRAVVKALAQYGAEVIAFSRTQSDLDSLQIEVPGVVTVCIDVANIDAVKNAVDSIGPIHLLVNNAGVSVLQSFLNVTPEAYDQMMNVNLKAVLFLSQCVAKGMVERDDGGAIVNVSSLSSLCALKDHAVYCASKGGVDMLTKVMGLELGPHKIRVNAVNPTVVMTDMGKMAWSDPKKSGPMLDRIPLKQFAADQLPRFSSRSILYGWLWIYKFSREVLSSSFLRNVDTNKPAFHLLVHVPPKWLPSECCGNRTQVCQSTEAVWVNYRRAIPKLNFSFP